MFGRFRGRGRGWGAGWFPRCGFGLGLGFRRNNYGYWDSPPWNRVNTYPDGYPSQTDYKTSLEAAKSALEQRLAEINEELNRQS